MAPPGFPKTVIKNKRKLLRSFGAFGLVLSAYPLFVLIYTWSCVFRTDLEGGRHGPLDAYRHTLASAVVSYTLGERAVNFTTWLMESKGREPNMMDSHNNKIGARIGTNSKSFHELEPEVLRHVSEGAVNSDDPDRITWLPKSKWRKGTIW